MKHGLARFVITLGYILAATSVRAQDVPKANPPAQRLDEPQLGLALPKPKVWTDAEFAGLSADSRPVVLTWELAYKLAIVRFRLPRSDEERIRNDEGALAESLDGKAVEVEAERLGFKDFERFRKDFFGEPDAARKGIGIFFNDPSGPLFGLLRRLHGLEITTQRIESLRALKRVTQELVKGDASGITEVEIDRLASALEQAHRQLLTDLKSYRDDLDRVKTSLGLSPHAPVVPDRTRLSNFWQVFEIIQNWSHDPERKLEDLPKLVAQIPTLKNVAFKEGAASISLIDVDAAPGGMEAILRAAERTAIKNRKPEEFNEFRRGWLRGDVRKLAETCASYASVTRDLVASLRMKDRYFERMMAPPPIANAVSPSSNFSSLLEMDAVVEKLENQLVSLWCDYQIERMSLAQHLRMLPCHDWKSFFSQLDADSAVDQPPPKK